MRCRACVYDQLMVHVASMGEQPLCHTQEEVDILGLNLRIDFCFFLYMFAYTSIIDTRLMRLIYKGL